ncbi:SMI1/KNR4 family protein [Caldimonas brevitalea]|uniref:SMI1/KNR4 family protein n=1 Tax=Caldimonas brevitalea TaxID=413882 RepID=UPI0014708625|nr:SMI1/KNR4 family protein [Caldimonas brevitalea]
MDEESPVVGVSPSEIDALEKQAQLKLPGSYREFLAQCGRSAGLYAQDSDFFFPTIEVLNAELAEMLEEEGIDVEIPPNAFVFAAYQGYQYLYFICDGTVDPAVYLVTDGGAAPSKISPTFTELVRRGMEDYHRAIYSKKK